MPDYVCKHCGGLELPGNAKRYQGYCFACWNAGIPDLAAERDRAVQLLRRLFRRDMDVDIFREVDEFLAAMKGKVNHG